MKGQPMATGSVIKIRILSGSQMAGQVFFKPDEIPWAEWGLVAIDGDEVYVNARLAANLLFAVAL